MNRRTPLKRGGHLKRSGPLRKRSKKRQRIEPAYTAAKQAHLRDFPYCQIGPIIRQAGHSVRCTVRATHVHHVKGRVGSLLCDRRFFLSSCRGECHPSWIHEQHVDLARSLGLLA